MTRDNNVVKQTISALPTQRFSHRFSRISGPCTFYANSSFMYNNTSSRPPTNQTCTFKNIECKVGITRKVQMHEELFCLVRSTKSCLSWSASGTWTNSIKMPCSYLVGSARRLQERTSGNDILYSVLWLPNYGPPFNERFETSHRRDGPD